jgi:hypothetical protein
MPDRAGDAGYDNGRLSGALDEVIPLLSEDYGGMQPVANATMLSCSLDAFICARHWSH